MHVDALMGTQLELVDYAFLPTKWSNGKIPYTLTQTKRNFARSKKASRLVIWKISLANNIILSKSAQPKPVAI